MPLKKSEQVTKSYVDQKFDESREYVDQKFDESREYVDQKFDESREYVDQKFDSVMNKLDSIIGKLETLEQENSIGAYQTRNLEERLEEHEKRIVKLEKS